jgi:hypothetical protein
VNQLIIFTILTLFFSCASPVRALTVRSLWGDKDGFGQGIQPGQPIVSESDVNDDNDDGSTDQWIYGTQSWNHSYDFAELAGPAMYATLEIHWTGLGRDRRLTPVFLDTMLVGYLASGYDSDSGTEYHARVDVINLMLFLHLLDGTEEIVIRPKSNQDRWSLDYALLTVSDELVWLPSVSSERFKNETRTRSSKSDGSPRDEKAVNREGTLFGLSFGSARAIPTPQLKNTVSEPKK